MRTSDRVVDRYGNSGFIMRLYDDFSGCAMSCLTMTGEEWLAQQIIPFTPEQLAEQWASVACDTGGSIWSPVSLLEFQQ